MVSRINSPDPNADWQRVETYPGHGNNARRWAWEFLRRSPDYQQVWFEATQLTNCLKQEVSLEEFLASDPRNRSAEYEEVSSFIDWAFRRGDPRAAMLGMQLHFDNRIGPIVSQACSYQTAKAREWWLSYLLNPSDSFQPWMWEFPQFKVPIISRSRACEIFTTGQDPLGVTAPGRVWFAFDLAAPIKQQVRHVESWLQHEQDFLIAEGAIEVPKPGRVRSNHYVSQLRVLDALSEGVTDYKVLAQTIVPTLDNTYPDFRGDKRIEYLRKTGVALRDGGYKALLVALKLPAKKSNPKK